MKTMTCKTPLLTAATFVFFSTVSLGFADDEVPFAEARLFFQLNDTDGDLGVHLMLDGEPWKTVEIENPDERTLLDIRTRSKLRRQGLTELKFESAEPTFDELSPERFFARFPEGEYEIEGVGTDGTEYESIVEISHVLPAPPTNITVNGSLGDCASPPMVSGPFTISWDQVIGAHPTLGEPGDIDVERYEVAVEQDALTLTVEVEPDVTAFQVPSPLLSLGDLKIQVLVTDEDGNETSSETCFEVT